MIGPRTPVFSCSISSTFQAKLKVDWVCCWVLGFVRDLKGVRYRLWLQGAYNPMWLYNPKEMTDRHKGALPTSYGPARYCMVLGSASSIILWCCLCSTAKWSDRSPGFPEGRFSCGRREGDGTPPFNSWGLLGCQVEVILELIYCSAAWCLPLFRRGFWVPENVIDPQPFRLWTDTHFTFMESQFSVLSPFTLFHNSVELIGCLLYRRQDTICC